MRFSFPLVGSPARKSTVFFKKKVFRVSLFTDVPVMVVMVSSLFSHVVQLQRRTGVGPNICLHAGFPRLVLRLQGNEGLCTLFGFPGIMFFRS